MNTAIQLNTGLRDKLQFNNDCLLEFSRQEEKKDTFYFGDLDNSIKFDKYLRIKESAKCRINNLWETTINSEDLTCKKRYRPALECMIANLKVSYYHKKYISISLNKNKFPAGKEIQFYKYDIINKLIIKLEEDGWIYKKPGYLDRVSEIGRYTRIWATEKMEELLLELSPKEIYHDIANPVKLRKTKSKEEIRLNIIPKKIKEIKKNLMFYNNYMSNQLIQYTPQNENDNCILSFKTERKSISATLFAAYNRGDTVVGRKFKNGGRLYNAGFGYQLLPKEERKTISINKANTVEIDYSSLHIKMLYAKKGIQYNLDPYKALTDNEEHRIVFKKFFLTLINASNIFKAIGAIENDIKDIEKRIINNNREGKKSKERDVEFLRIVKKEDFNWFSVINKIKKVHSPIQEYICSDMGTQLMNIDSKIILEVIMHFTNKNIPCLPVHDSVIIEEEHRDELKEVMQKTYKKHMNGFSCNVK